MPFTPLFRISVPRAVGQSPDLWLMRTGRCLAAMMPSNPLSSADDPRCPAKLASASRRRNESGGRRGRLGMARPVPRRVRRRQRVRQRSRRPAAVLAKNGEKGRSCGVSAPVSGSLQFEPLRRSRRYRATVSWFSCRSSASMRSRWRCSSSSWFCSVRSCRCTSFNSSTLSLS